MIDARLEQYLVQTLGEGVRVGKGALARHICALAEYYDEAYADDLEYQCQLLCDYLEEPALASWLHDLAVKANLIGPPGIGYWLSGRWVADIPQPPCFERNDKGVIIDQGYLDWYS